MNVSSPLRHPDPVLPPVIVTEELPDGVVDTAYSVSLEATGGEPPYAWTVLQGSLTDGLTLTSAGEITGTPTGVADPVLFPYLRAE